MRSPIRQMIRPRSDGVIRLHGPVSNARRAAFTARSMSSASPSATRARVSPVAGLGVSNVLPDAESDHRPLMNSCRGTPRNASTLRSRVTVMNAHLPLLYGTDSHTVAASLHSTVPCPGLPAEARLIVLIVQRARRPGSYPTGRTRTPGGQAPGLPDRPLPAARKCPAARPAGNVGVTNP